MEVGSVGGNVDLFLGAAWNLLSTLIITPFLRTPFLKRHGKRKNNSAIDIVYTPFWNDSRSNFNFTVLDRVKLETSSLCCSHSYMIPLDLGLYLGFFSYPPPHPDIWANGGIPWYTKDPLFRSRNHAQKLIDWFLFVERLSEGCVTSWTPFILTIKIIFL